MFRAQAALQRIEIPELSEETDDDMASPESLTDEQEAFMAREMTAALERKKMEKAGHV